MSLGSTLVTGATGFLGRALVIALAAAGCRVIAIGRSDRDVVRLDGVEVHRIDLTDADAPDRLANLGQVEAVIHCAALSAPWGPLAAFRAINVGGTVAVLTAARRLGCGHFVHVSSPTVTFRFTDQIGVREHAVLPPPVNAYARTKAEAEAVVRAADGLGRTIIRPRAIYGRGDRSLLPRLVAACRRGPIPLLRDGLAVTDPTHVDDVVDAILSVLRSGPPTGTRTFNVSGGEAIPVRRMIMEAADRMGLVPRWRPLPWTPIIAAVSVAEAARHLVGLRGEPRLTRYTAGLLAFSQTLDLSAIQAATGWRPRVLFTEGLLRTFGERAGSANLR